MCPGMLDTDLNREQRTITLVFEEQVARTPEAIALVFGEEELRYRELDVRVKQLAHYLQSVGVGAESLVGVFMDRSLDMVVALLATLRAGGAYVPLDPAYPSVRIGFVIEDSGASVVLTTEHNRATITTRCRAGGVAGRRSHCNRESNPRSGHLPGDRPEPRVRHLHVGIDRQAQGGDARAPQRSVVLPCDGPCSRHRAGCVAGGHEHRFRHFRPGTLMDVDARIQGCRPWRGGHAHDRDGNRPPWHYSLSVDAVATPRMLTSDPHSMAVLGSVKHLLLGGEALPASLISTLRPVKAGEIYNMYGPTETTVWSTAYRIPEQSDSQTSIPIGRPLANTEIHVLDSELKPVPPGEPGELFIGGLAVARGYWDRPELTAERFIADPFGSGGRIYRTGDVVRFSTGRGSRIPGPRRFPGETAGIPNRARRN